MSDITEDSTERSDFVIVGLGGSAGSIPAFREFFRNVPADSDMAYVVVLHLSPEHDSHLADVLQGSTTLPVTQVQGAVKVEPNRVYVIPPNKSLAMSDGTLLLSEIKGFEERRAPIDIFFRTLADTHDSRAVCVILSGSGSDGSVGLRRIKENNGLALVQDPSEAQFEDMPRSSIATGLVDFILPVAEMPQRMIAYRDQLHAAPLLHADRADADANEQALIEVFTHIRVRTGHDFTNYKRATVLRRIQRRLAVREIEGLPAYAAFLRDHPDEVETLLRELLISVTSFFRDRQVWERVEEAIVPKLFAGKGPDDHVRVWVPGCATGEEAYTVAMLLSEAAGELTSPPDIQIFATDLDEHAIAKARNGYYTAAETADVSPERLRRHFAMDHDGFRVRRELREMILFAHHNVIRDPSFSHLQFVTCRNLLIYLNRTAQERALQVLHFALEPGGYLLLGTAESVDGAAQFFSTFDKETHIYQSRAVPRVVAVSPPTQLTVSADLRGAAPGGDARAEPRALRFGPLELHYRMLEDYAPPSLIVDDQYNILHLSENAVRYVHIAPGEASLNLLQAARPELRIALRSALFQAAQKGDTVVAPVSDVSIIVRPTLRDGDPARGYFLVLFDETTDAADAPQRPEASAAEPAAPHLEEELLRLRTQMRGTVKQYEIQAEEARAVNEELQAVNEELRSTAEELETSQEELQSLNEELHTVNQELKVKIDEISHANNDLRNLMSSTEIGTIFVDRNFRVKLFTPRIRDIFNLITADLGRSLLDITNKLMIDNLAADVEIVRDRLQTIEREVQTRDGRWHLMRLLPYRTADDHIEGTVLTFIDVTDRKRADDIIRDAEERQRMLLALSDTLRALSDPQEIIATAAGRIARQIHATVAYATVDADGDTVRVAGTYGDARIPGMVARDDLRLSDLPPAWRALSTGEDVFATDIRNDSRWGNLDDAEDEHRVRAVAAVPLLKAGRLVAYLVAADRKPREWTVTDRILFREVADRTWLALERARAEQALRHSEEQFRTLFETMDEGFALCELVRDENGLPGDMRCLDLNRAFEVQTGVSRAFVAGRLFSEVFPPMEPSSMDAYARVVETGQPQRFEQYLPTLQRWYDVRVYARGGDSFALLWDDITERRKIEEALRASEERHRIIVESARDYAIITTDGDGRITSWSPGAKAVFGWSASEAVTQSIAMTFTPEDRAGGEVEKELETARAHGSAPDVRWHVRKDGSRVFIEGTARALETPGGELRGFLKIGQDVTERRSTEEALRDSEARLQVARDVLEQRVRERTQQLEELSAQRQQLLEQLVTATEEERQRIARELHDELGQHITALRVGLSQPQDESWQDESLARMQTIVQRLDETIDRLTLELRPPVLDHLGLHGAITSLADAYAAASGLRVAVHLPAVEGERFSPKIETTIYRVVQEALTNVLKHAGASTVSVILEREGHSLRMIVEDDGQGFDADAVLTGIAMRGRFGLLGMRERLALVDGSLAIESEAGSGTTIYVRVPLSDDGKPS